MEPETDYDEESGVDVEICRTCEELTDNLRTRAAQLRDLDGQAGDQIPNYEDLMAAAARDRDFALDELTEHQRHHSSET